MSDLFKYINKTNGEITVGDYTIPLTETYPLLDAQDGILVDSYLNGVPRGIEYTPTRLDNIGIGTTASVSAELTVGASTATVCSMRIEPGVPPTTPVDGDIWTTVAGIFVQVNGVTKTIAFSA